MLHYHGTPCGGKREEASRFLAGRCALVPYPRPEDLGAALEFCDSVVLDNGAYTIWKQGGTLDVTGYTRWVEGLYRHPALAWSLIPDSIEGSEADNDAMLCDWPRGFNGVPVYHLHESLARAERLASEWSIVALGSSGRWPTPNKPGWWQRIAEVMDVICDEHGRPKCKLHGLRMLNRKILKRLPLASADSTNAVRNANLIQRFGQYAPATSSQRMTQIANLIESVQSAPLWIRPRQRQLFDGLPETPFALSAGETSTTG